LILRPVLAQLEMMIIHPVRKRCSGCRRLPPSRHPHSHPRAQSCLYLSENRPERYRFLANHSRKEGPPLRSISAGPGSRSASGTCSPPSAPLRRRAQPHHRLPTRSFSAAGALRRPSGTPPTHPPTYLCVNETKPRPTSLLAFACPES
jgi:hypothetical protein